MKDKTALPALKNIGMETIDFIYIKFLSPALHNILNIARRKLSCSPPRYFNDPIDCYAIKNESELKKFHDDNLRNMLKRIRVCSLSKKKQDSSTAIKKLSVQERLMWAHYSNAHKGFAIEYKSDFNQNFCNEDDIKTFGQLETKHLLADVNYASNLIDNIDAIVSSIDQTNCKQILSETILDKDKAFQYENEVRIITLAKKKEDFTYIDMPKPERVIFGRYCNENFIESTKKIFLHAFDANLLFFKITNKMEECKL